MSNVYNKFWVAIVGALGIFLVVLAPIDGEAAFVVTRNEWFQVLVAFATAIGVRQVANR